MKAAIITLYGNYNFGNKLQNYAIQEILKKYQFSSETLLVSNSEVFDQKINQNKNKIISYLKKIKNIKNITNRKNAFAKFDQKITKRNISYNELKNTNYDKYVIGSDQVWNAEYNGYSYLYFLPQIPKEKKLSYAASFGLSDIHPKYQKIYKEGLENIGNLSVREEDGKEIIKSLTNRDSTCVVDPTMLLEKKDWELVMLPSKKIPKKYILLYYLGKKNKNFQKEIKTYAKKNKLKIIDLMDSSSPFYASGPSEFLYLINHAELVITDSFHACVFSILFHKYFIVVNRIDKLNMNSRILTILNKFNLTNQYYDEKKKIEEFMNIDYDNVELLLTKERKIATEFLKKAL